MKNGWRLIFIFVLSIPIFSFGEVITSKNSNLIASRLPDGNIQIENKKIKTVISPRYGGRILSLLDKATMEELMPETSITNPSDGGAAGDIFDGFRPGTSGRNYNLKSFELSKGDDKISVEMTYSLGDSVPEKDGLSINKKIIVDDFSASVHTVTEAVNNSGQKMIFNYWNDSVIGIGKADKNSKTLWVPLSHNVESIAFNPSSGSHGTGMNLTDGFIGITSAGAKISAAWLFNKEKAARFETWHKKDSVSCGVVYQKALLDPNQTAVYDMDIAILPEMKSVSGGNNKYGLAGSVSAQLKGSKLTVEAGVFKYTKESLAGVKWSVDLIDNSGNSLLKLKEDSADLNPEEMLNLSASGDVGTKLRGNFGTVLFKLTDSAGIELLTMTKKFKTSETSADSGKPMVINMMWVLHQPIYPSSTDTAENIQNTIGVYSNISALYERHPSIKSDIAFSGALLYQLLQYNPEILDKYKSLVNKKTLSILASGFSHPILPFLLKESINTQVKMDRDFKSLIFGVKPSGIYLPEMAYRDGIFEPIFKNEINWGYFSDITLKKGYRSLPDIDYYQPSRVISSGFGMNCLIQDQKALNILMKGSDQSIDEFIQYLMEVNEKNKDNKRVFVIAGKGEFFGNGELMEKLFARMEKMKWLKFTSGEDIFKSYIPTQTFLGEKIDGSWYADLETDETTLKPWINTKTKAKLWEQLAEAESSVITNGANIQRVRENIPSLDISFPLSIFEGSMDNLVYAEESDWYFGNNEKGYSILTNMFYRSANDKANVYDNLMSMMRNNRVIIQKPSELGQKITETEKETLNKIATGKFQIWDKQLDPSKITALSCVTLRFKILDKINGIDYNHVDLIVNINGSEDSFKIKAGLTFNGTMKAVIGNSKAGDEVSYIIVAKDKKGNDSKSEKFTYTVEP